jgi:hypothetical protein
MRSMVAAAESGSVCGERRAREVGRRASRRRARTMSPVKRREKVGGGGGGDMVGCVVGVMRLDVDVDLQLVERWSR